MTATRFSVALTHRTHVVLRDHLLRTDGQEDLCLATYAPSSGISRETALIREVFLPEDGERVVNGNVTFTGRYVLRVAQHAAHEGLGISILHSHPNATRWQEMSGPDADAEASFGVLAAELTGLPLLGMTLAGKDETWSARRWHRTTVEPAASVRVASAALAVSFNDRLMPPPRQQVSQLRTVSSWGIRVQDDVARLRVLVVGAGSVGLDVAVRLAATGIQHVAVMDYDTVETHNLDRLIGATPLDAYLSKPKVEVALRELRRATTAKRPEMTAWTADVTTSAGQRIALDYDLIFSCVDRPLPRAVLNQIAYADLIPVIDGGIAIDNFPDGRMRNATWRSHIIQTGYPCLICSGQISPTEVTGDRDGSLNDPTYIRITMPQTETRQNVAVLSASVSASMLAVFTSLVATPGGLGTPGPLQYSLSNHHLDHRSDKSLEHCRVEARQGLGDQRVVLTVERSQPSARPGNRSPARILAAWADRRLETLSARLNAYARRSLDGGDSHPAQRR